MATLEEQRKNKLEKIKAKGYYEELAQYGMLEEFIRNHFGERFDNDIEFRDRILEIMRRNSLNIEPELEKDYLEKLLANINDFLENTKVWRTHER